MGLVLPQIQRNSHAAHRPSLVTIYLSVGNALATFIQSHTRRI
jgi:hypothetical protein